MNITLLAVPVAVFTTLAAAAPGDPWFRLVYCDTSGNETAAYGSGDCAGAEDAATMVGFTPKSCKDLIETGVGPTGGNFGDMFQNPVEVDTSGGLWNLGTITVPDVGPVVIGFYTGTGPIAFRPAPGTHNMESARLDLKQTQGNPDVISSIAFVGRNRSMTPVEDPSLTVQGIDDITIVYSTGIRAGNVAIDAFAYDDLIFTPVAEPCPADLAQPFGVLDLADIDAFIAGFTTSDPVADLAQPFGVLDLADIDAFIASFFAGCP